ncbi:hypothetical protein B566_EDAN008939 [Ephemera danica]|nr:hypothetical protein B566_EDAN008939 [Ephemera danica]
MCFSSCFQLLGEKALGLAGMQRMLDTSDNPALSSVLAKYHVQSIERCSPAPEAVKASAVQVWVLALAALVGFVALIASIVVCCLHQRYKRQMKRLMMMRRGPGTVISSGSGGYAFVMPAPAGSVVLTAPPSVAGTHPAGLQDWPPELLATPASLLPPGAVQDAASYRSFNGR